MKLHITDDRLYGCAPLLVRMLTLFSFSRCVAVNRRLRHVIVETCHLWRWRRTRVVSFDRIARVVYRAQLMPAFSVSFSSSNIEPGDSQLAVFFIGLALKDARSEVRLFTVWERQPRKPDLLDALAGMGRDDARVGDEAGAEIVTLLREYLGVPIAPR